ncbi:helix-turn-helix domain-containing protein [Qipengyuania flava]|uniref:helix-turn-helix domain-containing protein n=1 Tax=Qipengyuania flava TaxID=192812 RepID=UPI00102E3558|nr:helix-turn-helix domain-containing protein [Qipengyuania flava]
MFCGSISGRIQADTETGRKEPRLTLNIAASLRQGEQSGNVQVLNISRSGLLLRTDFGPLDEQAITITIPNVGDIDGRIVWKSSDFVGCQFDRPLRRADLLAARIRNGGADVLGTEPMGSRIKRLREASGLSLVALAERVGTSKPTVWKWETGKMLPSRESFLRLCEVLRVGQVELAYGEADRMASQAPLPELSLGLPFEELVQRYRELIAHALECETDQVEIVIRNRSSD